METSLYYFNPTCEMAVANGQVSYMPPLHLRKFSQDLSALPTFFAHSQDVVLTHTPLPVAYTDHLGGLGFSLPQFIQQPEGIEAFRLPLSGLKPWGWSPAVHHQLKPYKLLTDAAWQQHPMSKWQPGHRMLLSRTSGYQLLKTIQQLLSPNYDLVEIPSLPVKVSSLQDIELLPETLPPPALLKTPWSASGRGLFKIRDRNEQAEKNAWVKSKLKQQGFLLAEPFLDKMVDLSFHFMIGKEEVSYLGCNFFETDASGQFLGCYTHFPPAAFIDHSLLTQMIEQGAHLIHAALRAMNLNNHYQGPAGVDAMVFLNGSGQPRLHPAIELNLRYSMGLLNLHLRRRIHPEANGKWRIAMTDQKQWQQLDESHNKKMDSMLNDGYIARGVVALTPPPAEKGFMAWLSMEP